MYVVTNLTITLCIFVNCPFCIEMMCIYTNKQQLARLMSTVVHCASFVFLFVCTDNTGVIVYTVYPKSNESFL